MITTALIAFREFFEAFLMVGVFFGISRKLHLKCERDIIVAALTGFIFSLALSCLVYFFADISQPIFTHENSELLESYLMIFSGCFIAYVVFSLHRVMAKNRGGKILRAHQAFEQRRFDFPLFVMIATLVGREGIEIALFTATSSLFSGFGQNLIGLIVGFSGAAVVGGLSYMSYLKFPIQKVFRSTEYLVILLGASLVQRGITELIDHWLKIDLSKILNFSLGFLPSPEGVLGHLLQTFTGIDSNFSLPRLMIMFIYILLVYILFLRKGPTISAEKVRK